MNKKQFGTIIAAGVLTLGLATSYAYFNDKTSTIGGNGGGDLAALTITNGKVAVSAKATGQTSIKADWSYDVVKYSKGGSETNGVITTENTLEKFQNKHRSPDISVGEVKLDGSNVQGESFNRANIGASISGAVNYARPGDAIVLGTADDNGKIGLQVTNSSNLTVKMQLVVKTDTDATTELTKLTGAGWKMYVGGIEVPLTAGNIVDLGVVAPGGVGTLVDVRFELPLATGNAYQGKDGSTGVVSDLDLSNLIEIQATQENNSGWNQDGSGEQITDKATEVESQE